MTTTAAIRKLTIQRFRGLEKFDWHPQPGMNVVLGKRGSNPCGLSAATEAHCGVVFCSQ